MRFDFKNPRWLLRLCAVTAGLLLSAAFPPVDWGALAFVAFVPLLLVVRGEGAGSAFRLGWFAGAAQWLVSVFWLHHVSWFAWVGMAFYCALYTGLFGMIAAALWRACGVSRLALFFLPSMLATTWGGLEWIRGTFATGFAWLPLAASQHENLPLLQLAGWGGSYLVSAVVMWINVALAVTIREYVSARAERRRPANTTALAAFLLLALAWAHGIREMHALQPTGPILKAALIQPAIPQMDKWTPEMVETIYERLRTLTRKALASEKPDLVIWPETAVPDDIRTSTNSYDVVLGLVTNGAPILLGSTDTEYRDAAKPRYFNSTFLFSTNGVIAGTYDKQHLVAFGEYIPPMLGWLTPIEDSFTSGTNSRVFKLNCPVTGFSTMICFEDTVADVARGFVLAGAHLLVNMSNDAWFDPSSCSRQHMLHSVLRAVENRVPVLRSCNTGVSCCINRFGRVIESVTDERNDLAGPGFLITWVSLPLSGAPQTFFTRHGDWFGPGAAGVAGLLALGALWRRRKQEEMD
ncbi:MAG: apolipoprotein N-acyltransferase [Kiritimatiellaeota bacterium]|nr:apolipoprotein N-acyltransferase [Kiritimatiellota bacterium]